MSITPLDGGYELDDDPERIDGEAVWSFLSRQAYWERWRTRDDVLAQIGGAWRVVGAYDEDGDQVGFARAVSDGVSIAYLADVYVEESARGRGIGQRLVETMVDGGRGAHYRWLLHTRDAHALYRKLGFAPPSDRAMERPGRPT